MTTQVICPDCGKQIAPVGAVDEAARCRCAEESSKPRIPVSQTKTCYNCGRPVVGQKRYRDKVGRYWCYDCAKAEWQAEDEQNANRCPDCGKNFQASSMFDYGDIRVCKACYRTRIEDAHKKLMKMSIGARQKKAELKSIMWMAIILLALLLIGTIAQFLT